MAVKKKAGGKWEVRVQLPTNQRTLSGAKRYINRTDTFSNKGAAQAWEKQVRKEHAQTGHGGSLNLAEVSEYREAKKIAGDTDLRQVAEYWQKRNPPTGQITVKEAVERYRKSPEWKRLAATTVVTKTTQLNQFLQSFGDTLMNDVAEKEVQDYLAEIPAIITRNNHLRTLKTFFKWSTRINVSILTISPVERLETEPQDYGTPTYMPLKEVHQLFETAIETDTGLIAPLALGFFAGIRTSEILQLEPKDFLTEDKRINIRSEVAKRKRLGKPLPRLIEGLPDTLWQWLEAVDFNGELDTRNFNQRRAALVKKAEVSWGNSIARHTFATYAYAYFQDAGRVRKITGHRGDDSVLLSHYAGLEVKSRGDKYFYTIVPPGEISPKRTKSVYENRATWPDDEELLSQVEKTSVSAVGRQLGVSEAAVRKHLKKIRATA